MDALRIEDVDGGVRLWVKAVPGAKRDGVAGRIGDRLKVRVSAPAEGGKANDAIVRVLARALGVKVRDVSIVTGASNPEKIVLICGLSADEVRRGVAGA